MCVRVLSPSYKYALYDIIHVVQVGFLFAKKSDAFAQSINIVLQYFGVIVNANIHMRTTLLPYT